MNKNYHWITPTVAVGNWLTPNSLFSIIVDLNFPDNQAREGEIHVLSNVIYVGIRDSPDVEIQPLIERVMLLLKDTPHRKILFRSKFGLSRSVTAACFYLKETLLITPLSALEMIQSKRMRIKKTDFVT